MLGLARWLGPWADAKRSPRVERHEGDLAGIRTAFYGSRRSRTRFLIAPGLHFAGPDDPRMDRFCRILAHAGHHVIAPYVPAYLDLRPSGAAVRDFARIFDALEPGPPPTIFSISFGSLLAFALAAERGDAIDRLVIFGGYADFHETMKFCLTGEVASGRMATRDPLNQPVVLLNLLDQIANRRPDGLTPTQRDALVETWKTYVTRTWGRPEMKARERFVAVAQELAPSVPDSVRDLYLLGIGVTPGAWDVAVPALRDFDATDLDPSPYLARVRNRVELVHGTDDDVIPYEQSQTLAQRLVNARVRLHITGLYGHTGAQRPPLSALAREAATLVRVLRVLAMASRSRRPDL
jgi:pimeloyl-ACP methyl ester carboxylesterase